MNEAAEEKGEEGGEGGGGAGCERVFLQLHPTPDGVAFVVSLLTKTVPVVRETEGWYVG